MEVGSLGLVLTMVLLMTLACSEDCKRRFGVLLVLLLNDWLRDKQIMVGRTYEKRCYSERGEVVKNHSSFPL